MLHSVRCRPRQTVVVVAALWLALWGARPARAEVPKDVAKATKTARKKASDALVKLGKWCAARKGYDAAREEFIRAIAVAGDPKKAREELGRVAKKEDAPKEGFDEALDAERETVHAACTELLHGAADRALAANSPDGFDDVVTLMLDAFPDADTKEKYELKWFDPYLRWVRSEDLVKLDAGGEFVDGTWLDAEAVTALNAEHESWDSRWKIGNGVFRVETGKPLRAANTFLAHATAFRRWFLAQYGDVWEMKPGKGELPILVTRDQAEWAKIFKQYRPGEPLKVMGLYLMGGAPPSPVLMTYEPVFSGDGPRMVEFHVLQKTLYHEVAHQLGTEYSLFARKGLVTESPHFWAAEGIANHCSWMKPGERGWRLTKPTKFETIPNFAADGSLAWVKSHIGELEPVSDFVKTTQANYHGRKYDHGTALSYFLLTYDEGRYREAFLDLCEDVHRGAGKPDGLSSRLDGVSLEQLQEQFVEFMEMVSVDR